VLVADGEIAIAVGCGLIRVRRRLVRIGGALVDRGGCLIRRNPREPFQIGMLLPAIPSARPCFPGCLLRHNTPIPRLPSDVARKQDA
jgi:hypothetical protein